jgi:cell wall-associated NlpC family hydrolase
MGGHRKMIKKNFIVLLAMMICLSIIPIASYAQVAVQGQQAVVLQSVSFRDQPSLSSERIRYLQEGETVEVLSQPNSYWLYVKDGTGRNGYVTTMEKYIQLQPIVQQPAASAWSAKAVSYVSFRTGPSTGYDRIRYLQPDEYITILEKINDYWYKATDSNNVTGYLSSNAKYITIVTAPTAPTQTQEQTAPSTGQQSTSTTVEPNAAIVSSVSFRTGPSTGDSRIRYLQTGEKLWVLSKVNAYWYKAQDINGVTGYLSTSSKYIELIAPLIEQQETAPSTADEQQAAVPVTEQEEPIFTPDPNATALRSVSFRTGPSIYDSRIRYLQTGEKLWVLDKVNSYWYKAQDKNGTIGYVSSSSYYIDTTYVDYYKKLVPSDAAQMVIDAGMKYLGTPYEFGSSRYNTETFDCSDFVRQAFLDGIELQLPGNSRTQAEYVKEIGKTTTDWRALKPGDIVFFMSYKGYRASDYEGIDKSAERITHDGIYLGNGQVLHTFSKESGGVQVTSIVGNAWEYRMIFGGSAF